MDGFQLKHILSDIVNYAYTDSPKLKAYKAFYVELNDKNLKSKLGDYNCSTQHIRIFRTGTSKPSSLIIVAIHELAHHIDNMNRGTSDHQSPFYAEYKKLLYAGLDLNLFTLEEYCKETTGLRDYNKVLRMIKDYTPAETDYGKNQLRMNVHNAYAIKEDLKSRGYKYDSRTTDWYKLVNNNETNEEISAIERIIGNNDKITYELTEALEMSYVKHVTVNDIPDTWCDHTFTPEEKEMLFNGNALELTNVHSLRTGKAFSCQLFWENGKLQPVFNK